MWSARLAKPNRLKLPPRIKVVPKRIGDASDTAIDAYARDDDIAAIELMRDFPIHNVLHIVLRTEGP
jgi:hypothetical protein